MSNAILIVLNEITIPFPVRITKFMIRFDHFLFLFQCQQHEQFLASGERAGFLIGDGAGVGKGRTIAGIIFENFLQGRKKAIWVCYKSST